MAYLHHALKYVYFLLLVFTLNQVNAQYLNLAFDGQFGFSLFRDAERVGDKLIICGVSANSGTTDGVSYCYAINENSDTVRIYSNQLDTSRQFGGYVDCNDTICASAWTEVFYVSLKLNAYLAVFDTAGILRWQRRYDSIAYRFAVQGVSLTEFGVLAYGFAEDSTDTGVHGIMALFDDETGDLIWSSRFRNPGTSYTYLFATVEQSDSAVSAIFYQGTSFGNSQPVYTEWNLIDGSLTYDNVISTGCEKIQIYDAESLTDTTILISGALGCDGNYVDVYVAELDRLGNILWWDTIGNDFGNDSGYFIEVFPDYFMVGGVYVNNPTWISDFDPFVAKYSLPDRSRVFNESYTNSMIVPNEKSDWIYGGAASLEGGVCVVGSTRDSPSGLQAQNIICVDSIGCAIPNCIASIPSIGSAPDDALFYPNPVSGGIINTKAWPGAEAISIYNSVGVSMYNNVVDQVGKKFEISVSSWPSGLYLGCFQLSSGGEECKKIVIE